VASSSQPHQGETLKRIATPALLGCLILLSLPLHAQLSQTYVTAVKGDDHRPCDFDRPCRTVDRAITQTNAKGEVIILDSGPYDPFTVSKSVTISAAPGVQATITVALMPASQGPIPGVTVNAGPDDRVTLRGLTINGLHADAGVRFTSGASLAIEGCVVDGSILAGIVVAGPGTVFIKDTTVRNCSSSPFDSHGVFIYPLVNGVPTATTSARVTIEHSQLLNNAGYGVYAVRGSKVTIRDSVASGNSAGFGADAIGGVVEMDLENSAATDNGLGVTAAANGGGTTTVRVSGCLITNNAIGVSGGAMMGVALLSRGNNTMVGNSQTDGAFNSFFDPR
jgi:hypothetical protein